MDDSFSNSDSERDERPSMSTRPRSGLSRRSFTSSLGSASDVTQPVIRQVRPLSRAGRGNSAYDRELFGSAASGNIEEYFEYLETFEPETIDFEPRLRPFLPDYLPCIGSVDPILKVTKPYGGKETLGIMTLDEPCVPQSDPAILALQLRSLCKHLSDANMIVKNVTDLDGESDIIDKWIKEVGELHKANPVPIFRLPENMPPLEELLEQFSPEEIILLREEGLRFSEESCTVEEYFENICDLFGIPTHGSSKAALFMLLSLYGAVQRTRALNTFM